MIIIPIQKGDLNKYKEQLIYKFLKHKKKDKKALTNTLYTSYNSKGEEIGSTKEWEV